MHDSMFSTCHLRVIGQRHWILLIFNSLCCPCVSVLCTYTSCVPTFMFGLSNNVYPFQLSEHHNLKFGLKSAVRCGPAAVRQRPLVHYPFQLPIGNNACRLSGVLKRWEFYWWLTRIVLYRQILKVQWVQAQGSSCCETPLVQWISFWQQWWFSAIHTDRTGMELSSVMTRIITGFCAILTKDKIVWGVSVFQSVSCETLESCLEQNLKLKTILSCHMKWVNVLTSCFEKQYIRCFFNALQDKNWLLHHLGTGS